MKTHFTKMGFTLVSKISKLFSDLYFTNTRNILMRDFLNEDELALLKEICASGQIELAKSANFSSLNVEDQAFKTGLIDVLKESFKLKKISGLLRIVEESCFEIDEIISKEFISDHEHNETISFLRGRACQSKFIVDRLIALRYVKNTLDPGNAYFISGEHLVYINFWRMKDLGMFKDVQLDFNTVT